MVDKNMNYAGQWPQIARQFLEQISHPLRPCAEDVNFFQKCLPPNAKNQDGDYLGLILGVTPELYKLTWPTAAQVYAVDRTSEMIDYVWPGNRDQVFQKNWLELDQIEKKFDVILCDGGWHLLSYPDQQMKLAELISNSLKPGGRFLVRLFVPPIEKEPVSFVLDALAAGKIPSLNHLKIRLGTAMQDNPVAGVRLGDVWEIFQRTITNRRAFADMAGWNFSHLQAIDAYRESNARYHFVELDKVIDFFKIQKNPLYVCDTCYPSYAMGKQFPLVSFGRD